MQPQYQHNNQQHFNKGTQHPNKIIQFEHKHQQIHFQLIYFSIIIHNYLAIYTNFQYSSFSLNHILIKYSLILHNLLIHQQNYLPMINSSKEKQSQEPQPLLLQNQTDLRTTMKSATYRNQKRGAILAISGSTDLNHRIANQLKKIGPEDLGQKPNSSLSKKQKHMHTASSGDYIKQCHDYNSGENPEIAEKLDELTQKINIIEYRQKKMQSKSRYLPQKEEHSASKQSNLLKMITKSTANDIHDMSKVVIKQLKTVKDEIKELKEIMQIIKEGRQESNIKPSKPKHQEEKSQHLNRFTSASIKINKEPFGLRDSEILQQSKSKQKQEQKRTVYYNKKLIETSQKNIPVDSNQLPEQTGFIVQPVPSTNLKSKGKPHLSNKVSMIPQGLQKSKFRVTKSVSKKSLISPYLSDTARLKSKSQMQKPIMRKQELQHPDLISSIQNNFDGEDLDKKIIIMPKLPDGFNPILNSDQLLKLAKDLMIAFNVTSDWSTPINIKKFKNCVFFNHMNTNVLWHYDGKFYIGGWSKEGEGCKQGYGVESIPQKYIYEGQFHKGKRYGQGMMSSLNGEFYRGNWVNGYRHGKGKLEEQSGSTYQGQWVQGRKEGFGKMKFSKKECYQGMFNGGLKNGLGKQLFQNGDAYQGQYLNGKFNGQGIYRWSNGASYNGDFRDGRRHGKGVWIANDSIKSDMYDGQYQNDSKSGKGRFTWANGSVYIGAFSNDQKNGEGTIYYNDGRIMQAIWQSDQIVKQLYCQKPKSPGLKR